MTEQGTMPPQAASGSDEQALLQRLRDGEDAAFGELFELHAAAVRRLAHSVASDQSEAEDITAETFFRVLQALRRGAGPRDYVRAYLLTVARRVSWEWHGARRDVPVSDDELTFRAGAGADTNARSAEHTLITTAFTSLPERWRTVLWQTEVEGEQPAMVAPHFGLSANATAALARRARQGLRAAYLQAHLAVNRSSDGCRAVVEKLGGFTAGSVTGTEAQRIRTHLLGCSSCRATHDELRDVCSSLRAHAGVIVLLVPAAGLALSGAAGGWLTAAKSLLFGSKVKVGLALASTAAAGAFGVAVGPVVFGPDSTQIVGLDGSRSPELTIVQPVPPVPLPPQVAMGIGELSVRNPALPGRGTQRSAGGSGYVPANVYSPAQPQGGAPAVPAAGAGQPAVPTKASTPGARDDAPPGGDPGYETTPEGTNAPVTTLSKPNRTPTKATTTNQAVPPLPAPTTGCGPNPPATSESGTPDPTTDPSSTTSTTPTGESRSDGNPDSPSVTPTPSGQSDTSQSETTQPERSQPETSQPETTRTETTQYSDGTATRTVTITSTSSTTTVVIVTTTEFSPSAVTP
jgi:RNA polymerase sigma factor (sigma-70 family)